MSAGGAFGGNRGVRPVPPEKGVFPLDHLHECDLEKKDYLACLKSTGFQSEKCRQFSKKYLECRMERNLMAKQDMSELGFSNEDVVNTPPDKNDRLESPTSDPKEKNSDFEVALSVSQYKEGNNKENDGNQHNEMLKFLCSILEFSELRIVKLIQK